MAKDWFPTINSGLCQDNCFKCEQFCPQDVFARQEYKAIVAEPDKCLKDCDSCKEICPAGAIQFIKTQIIEVNGEKIGILGLEAALATGDIEKAMKIVDEHNYIPGDAKKEYKKEIEKLLHRK